MKNYIIGDIHGCIKTLKKIISLTEKNSTIFCLGDLTDKGPSSAEVLDFIIENKIKTIKGNHEIFFETYIPLYLIGENIKESNWYKLWGGNSTIESYKIYPLGKRKEKMIEHLDFIKNLPLYREINIIDENHKTAFLSHGFALPYYNDIENILKDKKTSKAIYSNRLYGEYFDIKKDYELLEKTNVVNIFGHDAFKEVVFDNLYIGIDTGCAYGKTEKEGGKLSMIEWPSKKIISVDSLDNSHYKLEKLS